MTAAGVRSLQNWRNETWSGVSTLWESDKFCVHQRFGGAKKKKKFQFLLRFLLHFKPHMHVLNAINTFFSNLSSNFHFTFNPKLHSVCFYFHLRWLTSSVNLLSWLWLDFLSEHKNCINFIPFPRRVNVWVWSWKIASSAKVESCHFSFHHIRTFFAFSSWFVCKRSLSEFRESGDRTLSWLTTATFRKSWSFSEGFRFRCIVYAANESSALVDTT